MTNSPPEEPTVKYEGPIFDVVSFPFEDIPQFDMVRHPGAVAVLPYGDGKIYLTKQYRPAVGRYVIETCAGTREPGEHGLMTAQRELMEELGLVAHTWQHIFSFHSSPGYTSELVHLYGATDLEETTARPEDTEKIEKVIVNYSSIHNFLANRSLIRGTADIPAKTLIALQWFLLRNDTRR